MEIARLEKEIVSLKNREYTTSDYKRSQLKLVGVTVPALRKYRPMEYKHLEDKLDFLNEVWTRTTISEVMTWVLIQCEKFKPDFLVEHVDVFVSWAVRIENWWHSDGLSSLYARILENNKSFLSQLNAWNKSRNPWLRRQSVVSLMYYASMRKKYVQFTEMKQLVKKLLDDKDYYVQKGVGWTLREMSQVYPEETKKFLFKHAQDISSVAFSASVEKVDYKGEIKKIRAMKRVNLL